MKTACWLYDGMLRLYPRAFYLRFARDMSADFHDGYAAAHRNSRAAIISFTARGYADLAVSLLSQWLATESFVIWRTSVLVAISIWTVAFTVSARMEWWSRRSLVRHSARHRAYRRIHADRRPRTA